MRSEINISLKGRGSRTKGKNIGELLVVLSKQNQIAITKILNKSRNVGNAYRKAFCKYCGNEALAIEGKTLKCYALAGKKKDDLGTVDDSTSSRHIMGMCFDF
jgi:hypothetical protein